jgi:hypothetical protein
MKNPLMVPSDDDDDARTTSTRKPVNFVPVEDHRTAIPQTTIAAAADIVLTSLAWAPTTPFLASASFIPSAHSLPRTDGRPCGDSAGMTHVDVWANAAFDARTFLLTL